MKRNWRCKLTNPLKLCLIVMFLIPSLAFADNPFGIMPGANPEPRVVEKVQELGATWLRPTAVFADRWRLGTRCPDCQRMEQSGVKLVITVRANGRDAAGAKRVPTTPPHDEQAYLKALTDILDAYRPAAVAIENEENAPPFYYDGRRLGIWDSPGDGRSTAELYRRQLDAACNLAKARRVLCANGGLTSEATATLVWYHYLVRGETGRACSFARRAFYTRKDPKHGETYCRARRVDDIPAKLLDKIKSTALPLLTAYREGANDVVNVHWYIHDPQALQEAVTFMREATGKPVIINEIGQWDWDNDPRNLPPLLAALKQAQVSIAIWYAQDEGGATGLFNRDGSLRPQGRAFMDGIQRLQ